MHRDHKNISESIRKELMAIHDSKMEKGVVHKNKGSRTLRKMKVCAYKRKRKYMS